MCSLLRFSEPQALREAVLRLPTRRNCRIKYVLFQTTVGDSEPQTLGGGVP